MSSTTSNNTATTANAATNAAANANATNATASANVASNATDTTPARQRPIENRESKIENLSALRAAYADWRKLVEADLKGVPFEKKLVTRTPEGIPLQPLYTRLDTAGLAAQDLATVRGITPARPKGYAGPNAIWHFAQEIALASPADFNAALLADLNAGQNAVAITLDRATRAALDADAAPAAHIGAAGLSINDLADLAAALNNVDLTALPIHIDAGPAAIPAAALYLALVRTRRDHPRKLHGSLTADPLGHLAATGALPDTLASLLDDLAHWTHFATNHAARLATIGIDASPWHDAGATAAHELAAALAALAEYTRELTTPARGLTPAQVLAKTRVTFATGSQFFMEIAKFRAFRALAARVAAAHDIPATHLAEATPKIHARTARWNKTKLDINVNMLRVTTEALSAILGGVDSLHIAPYDEVMGAPDDFSRRISRNIHTLLAEEFHLLAPADPAGGSFYIEKLTDDLARRAWTLFQEIETQGGYTAALRAGTLQAATAAAAKEKTDSLDKRRTGLIGTNLFPNLKEKPPVARPHAPAANATHASATAANATAATAASTASTASNATATNATGAAAPHSTFSILHSTLGGEAAAYAAARAAEIKQRRLPLPKLHQKVAATYATVPTATSSTEEDALKTATQYARQGATIAQLFALDHPAPTPVSSEATGMTPAITPIHPARLSEGYEHLRAASEAYAKTHAGARPKIFVAKMGTVAQHKARADFTAGFFATGGFDLLAKESYDTPESAAAAALASNAPVAVLCSTDETYPALVPPFAKTIKSGNPTIKVILAGLPPDEATTAAYKAAGIDDFIHIRANNRAMLAAIQKSIGA